MTNHVVGWRVSTLGDDGLLRPPFGSDRRVPMPESLGTLVAFPGWTVHEVHPITRGVRWGLIVNGYGSMLR